jgi:hypothetical protein
MGVAGLRYVVASGRAQEVAAAPSGQPRAGPARWSAGVASAVRPAGPGRCTINATAPAVATTATSALAASDQPFRGLAAWRRPGLSAGPRVGT